MHALSHMDHLDCFMSTNLFPSNCECSLQNAICTTCQTSFRVHIFIIITAALHCILNSVQMINHPGSGLDAIKTIIINHRFHSHHAVNAK